MTNHKTRTNAKFATTAAVVCLNLLLKYMPASVKKNKQIRR